MASNNELVVETLEYKKAVLTQIENTGAEKESTLEFTVSGKGDYEKIKEFVSKLEKLQRLVNIKSAEVMRIEEEEKLKFTVVGRVYYEISNC